MEIPGLISLPTLLISIQTIQFMESSLIPLPEQIAIPRSTPESAPDSAPTSVPEPTPESDSTPKSAPEPIPESAPEPTPESAPELIPNTESESGRSDSELPTLIQMICGSTRKKRLNHACK